MRLVIDLQGAQGTSRRRGIGRYSRALALAMAREPGPHEVWVALNENYAEAAEELRDEFRASLPPERIVAWSAPKRTAEVVPQNDGRRMAAERLRAAFLASLRPDLVHVSSLFEGVADDVVTGVPDDVELPPIVCTFYDAIPLLQQDVYLPEPRARTWYFRRLLRAKHAAGLLAISESSRREAIDHLGFAEDRVFNVLAGVDPSFRPVSASADDTRALLDRYGLPEDFILCLGAAEKRKNLDGLVRAYALLPHALRARFKLVVTGWNDVRAFESLRSLAERLGLPRGDVVFLERFVRDEDLPALYGACALFVLPSLHEGFGLPAAEAMACGAPVVGSRATSIPEVIGREDALFDPASPEDIAAKMAAVLTDRAFRADLVRHGVGRAASFKWEETARRAWRALEAIEAANGSPRAARALIPARKPRLTVVAPPLGDPLGSEASGRGALLAGLARHYHVDPIEAGAAGRAPLPGGSAPGEDRVLYLPGRDPRCMAATMDLLDAYPGVVALEGATPSGVLLRDGSPEGEAAFRRALFDAEGWPAVVASQRQGRAAAAARFSGRRGVLARAVGLLAVSDEEAAAIHAEGAGASAARRPVEVVPPCGPGAADAWHQAIESAYGRSPVAALDACLTASAAVPALSAAEAEADLSEVAASVAATFNTDTGRRLLLDVTGIAAADAGTGIQRVVRETSRHLAESADNGARVAFVRSTRGELRFAHGFGARLLGVPEDAAEDGPVVAGPGDVFVGLDLRLHEVDELALDIRRARVRGGRAVVVVYDLLPIRFPHNFPPVVRDLYPVWLRAIARGADGLVCISRSVADELLGWLEADTPERRTPLRVGHFHLGSDFAPSERQAPPAQLSPDPLRASASQEALRAAASRPTVLMVGTVEPRKGYAQAIAAFEALWGGGDDVGLVIVGRVGWLMDDFTQRMMAHREFGRRLHWLEAPSDAVLASLYKACGALLMASEGEGFGLPIIEAARAGLPIIARDLPVFREIAGDHAIYFPGSAAADPRPLAAAVREWLERRAAGREPDAGLIPTLSWRESAEQLLDVVLHEKWYRTWSPPSLADAPALAEAAIARAETPGA